MSDSGPWGTLGFLFFACLAAGISLVYLFCLKKFAERSVTENSDYIYQLLPKQLATREEYSKGFLIYFGSMAAMVALLALIGQSNQANLSMLGITLTKDASNVILPLAIALILIGALPTVPGLMLVEKYLRDYAHQRAYIPDAARATADRLAAADFDFSYYRGEALQSPELRGVEATDFTRSRHTLEYGWARLCCLVFIQKSCRMEGLTDSLDASLLRDYEKDLEPIESQKKSMEAEIAAYRAAAGGIAEETALSGPAGYDAAVPPLFHPRPPSPKISKPLSVTTTVSSSLMKPRFGCCSVVSTDTTMPLSSGRWAS